MNSRIKSTVAVRIFMASMLALLPSLGAVARATEHQGAFAGGGLGFGTTELSNEAYLYAVNPDKSVAVLEGHGGYRFNSYIALEGQLLDPPTATTAASLESRSPAFPLVHWPWRR